MIRKAIGCVAIVLAVGVAFGQPPTATSKFAPSPAPAKKSALEVALEEALQNNPDLRVSAAKAAEADAELGRTRAQVVQKVVAAYQAVEKAKADVAKAEEQAKVLRSLTASTPTGVNRVNSEAADTALAAAKATLASAESELEYLTGTTKVVRIRFTKTRAVLPDSGTVLLSGLSIKGPAAARLRLALEKKATFAFEETPAVDVLDAIRKQAGDLHIQVADKKHAGWSEKLTAKLTNASVAAALQLIEDTTGQRVVVREYGLLIAPQEKLPPGALPLAKFLESKDEPAKPTTKQ